jgi:hypothetical protein
VCLYIYQCIAIYEERERGSTIFRVVTLILCSVLNDYGLEMIVVLLLLMMLRCLESRDTFQEISNVLMMRDTNSRSCDKPKWYGCGETEVSSDVSRRRLP